MSQRGMGLTASGLVLLAVGGCAKNDPLYEKDDVATWANTGSALAVWTNIDTAVSFAVGHTTFEDPVCPATSDDGTTVTITGDCTDSTGKNWAGEAVIERVGAPTDLDLALDGFGSSDDEVAGVSGTARVREVGADVHSFEVDIVHEGGASTEIDYTGTVSGDYDTATVWNGSGTVTRSGLVRPTGTVQMHTDDAVWDDSICAGQAASGTTTIESDDHVVVVTYDGETDCDEDQAARWSVDGEDRGLVEGITCAVGSNTSGGWLLLPLLVGLGRRRTRGAKR